MLTSSGSGGITPVSRTKTYYTAKKRGTAAAAQTAPNYDSAKFSSVEEGSGFQMQMEVVSRLSREVRTATTTGDIQDLRQAVSSGTYAPDPMAIAARMLFLSEDETYG